MKLAHSLVLRSSLLVLGASLTQSACNNKKTDASLAPTSSSLTAAKGSEKAQALEIDSSGSKVTFLMEAPVEKISGEAIDATKGQLFVDPADIMKTTGLIQVDIDKMVLFQQKREDDKSEFGEKTKNDKQNKDARQWLEVGEDAPADAREKNRWVEYKIDKVIDASAKDLTKMTGVERKITATVEGEFRLHQRKTRKQAKIEATFKFDGDKLSSVSVKTVAPMSVGLEEHEVVPREIFGKLAKKTLNDLGQKVGKDAPISLELTAKAKSGGGGGGY